MASSAAAVAPMPVASSATDGGPVQQAMFGKLVSEFAPEFVSLANESYMHGGGPSQESHFKLVLVSAAFNDTKPLQRHRMVNTCLQQELATLVHALSITARTPQQWQADHSVTRSPSCLGGSKHDKH
jgi:BolA protein